MKKIGSMLCQVRPRLRPTPPGGVAAHVLWVVGVVFLLVTVPSIFFRCSALLEIPTKIKRTKPRQPPTDWLTNSSASFCISNQSNSRQSFFLLFREEEVPVTTIADNRHSSISLSKRSSTAFIASDRLALLRHQQNHVWRSRSD